MPSMPGWRWHLAAVSIPRPPSALRKRQRRLMPRAWDPRQGSSRLNIRGTSCFKRRCGNREGIPVSTDADHSMRIVRLGRPHKWQQMDCVLDKLEPDSVTLRDTRCAAEGRLGGDDQRCAHPNPVFNPVPKVFGLLNSPCRPFRRWRTQTTTAPKTEFHRDSTGIGS